jgi:hypothetical protein
LGSAASSSREASTIRGHPLTRWAARARELGRAVAADWSRSHSLHLVVGAVLGQRRARR